MTLIETVEAVKAMLPGGFVFEVACITLISIGFGIIASVLRKK